MNLVAEFKVIFLQFFLVYTTLLKFSCSLCASKVCKELCVHAIKVKLHWCDDCVTVTQTSVFYSVNVFDFKKTFFYSSVESVLKTLVKSCRP